MHYDLSLRLGIELLGWVLMGALVLLVIVAARKFRMMKRRVSEKVVLVELTPPPFPHNTLLATEEFFAVLAHVVNMRSWRELLTGHKSTMALEVVSTREQGIRYVVRLPRPDLPILLSNLASLAPTVTAEEVPDYWETPTARQVNRLLDLRQTGSAGYPLKYNQLESASDPIAYITNAISRLHDDELIVLQLVCTPASDWRVSSTAPQPTNPGADIVAATLHKAHQPQFQTSIRVLVRTTTRERNDQRVKGIRSALTAYSYEGYQSLQPRLELPGWIRHYHLYAFANRLPALFSRYSCLLASSELAALFHFPYGTATQTEDLQLSHPSLLPMPLAIKNHTDIDVVIGENSYRGRKTPIGLTTAERQRHMYVVGGTGNGKSTLLQYAIVQDMQADKGVAVIDPHGDLTESLLSYVPEKRIDDVVYFNPCDIAHPISINLLELTPGLDEDELLQEKDLVTESIVSMFRKIFSAKNPSGHRIEYILRNTVQTALTVEGATLFTVYDLLNDSTFRKRIVKTLTNADLKLFWREFGQAGSYQQVNMAAGITTKIGRFLFSAAARRTLEQPESTINFDELMEQGKILICNVSKGKLGEDTSELFGIMILAKLQLATLRRANRIVEDRRPFYVYVDEFQNFATPSFVQLLSEARKYGLFLTMAEQSTSQQSDPRIIDIVLANVGTIIAFRTSSPQDERLLQPLLSPHVEPGLVSHLPAYSFYVRIAASESQAPFSGQTVLMENPGDPTLGRLVVQASHMQYSRSHTSPAARAKPSKPEKSPSTFLAFYQLISYST